MPSFMAATEQSENAQRIRIAQPVDAEAITTLINTAFRTVEQFFIDEDRITVTEVRALLVKGSFLLAENKGNLIGCVYVEPRKDRAYLGLLAVDPTCQQSGVGSLLMHNAESHCRAVSCKYMDIRIVNLRSELPEFYQKRGYFETGTSAFDANIETKLPCHFIEMSKRL
jgi:N-acetylglutamate synthase-like GNAT family acetyltransferase